VARNMNRLVPLIAIGVLTFVFIPLMCSMGEFELSEPDPPALWLVILSIVTSTGVFAGMLGELLLGETEERQWLE
jgi:Kef-type K+ transport system membrane component KefB